MSKPKKQRKNPRGQRRAADRALKRRARCAFGKSQVVVGPAFDGVKMSEVLEEFIAPYRELAETKEAFERLATLAAAAWNPGLLPKDQKRSHFLQKLVGAFPEYVRDPGGMMIERMIDRKKRFFSHHRRMILGCEVAESGTNWHLSVISTTDSVKVPNDRMKSDE